MDQVLSEGALREGLTALGYQDFRPGQREAVETLLSVGRLLLVAPTGGGKSLSYQLPASLLPGTSLIVSPLIALMNDQVQGLEARGVRATFLASTLSSDELRRRMAGVAAGEYKIVYVAPERLAFGGFRAIVAGLSCPLVAIDEAHCISEWGHDFRPEYMQIGDLLRHLPKARVLACTATATPVVRDEILMRLGLGPDTPQLLRGFARPNLVLRAVEVDGARQRRDQVDRMLAEVLGNRHDARGAAIVYAPTRRQADEEAERLLQAGYRAGVYHAGLPPAVRRQVQGWFSEGSLDVVVATNAFGMGIDRSDVRAVVHLAPPSSIEAYYQEVGRAGRDGELAYGLLLASHRDMALRRRLLELPVDGRPPEPRVVEHKWNLFLELMRWVEGGSCRHDAILRYFGDEAETLAGCGRCDVCRRMPEFNDPDDAEVATLVRKSLSGVARVHGRFGLGAAARLLVGKSDPRLARLGVEATSTFGVLAEHSLDYVVKVLRRCVTAGWVGFGGEQHPTVLLTPDGVKVMRGQRAARILLPSTARIGVKASGEASGGAGIVRPARQAPASQQTVLDGTGERVFAALRAQRLQLSREQGVPPYVIASDRSLRDLAMLRPRNLNDLLMVHGIGPAKLERYGQGWLDVVAQNG